jgi:hypothetical protein
MMGSVSRIPGTPGWYIASTTLWLVLLIYLAPVVPSSPYPSLLDACQI